MLHEAIAPPALRPDTDLQAARSELLDAFSDLETLIGTFLKDADVTAKAQHLGVLIEEFKKIKGTPRIANANYGKRNQLAEDVAALLPVRADIVHSRMKTCQLDGKPAGIFVNSINVRDRFPPCRILTAEELRTMCNEVLRIVRDLKKLGQINPASSPQPPLQAVAGDP